ncbi:MAG: hypothetical protein AAF493_03120 [Pseudomonadota bacterium]
MIETQFQTESARFTHRGAGTVTTQDLLGAIYACNRPHESTLWDFSNSTFDVPLSVVRSPTFPPVKDAMNRMWVDGKLAFIVGGELQKLLVQTFMTEGQLEFDWRIFLDADEATEWLDTSTITH